MALEGNYFWRKAPFLKLLPALVAGILSGWYFHGALSWCWLIFFLAAGTCSCFFFLPVIYRYRFSVVAGIAVCLLVFSVGSLLSYHKDIRNNNSWLGRIYQERDACIVTLCEPISEKTNSFKAEAKTGYLLRDNKLIPVKGRILVYFRKDPANKNRSLPGYGDRILLKKQLQAISNSGNPAAFDYKRYALFRGITHQVFLGQEEFCILPGNQENSLKREIIHAREKILAILRRNIKGNRELGLAEALLIGYRDDLDPSLVQSYASSGVVHIIAISGLHLGLIYGLLLFLLKPLKQYRRLKWVRPILLVSGLWSFSLLAGAHPSVLRAALMFSFIVLGESFSRRTSIYNTLAASAFLLLCINPFWLWDTGFQLSYCAVGSIIIFMRPVYNLFYFKNRILDRAWKMSSVTLAAQVLTTPLTIYYFHQFPLFFLLTNIIAVPLSGIIIAGEILVCLLSFIPLLSLQAGALVSFLIAFLNNFIERIGAFSFSRWEGLQLNLMQVLLLFVFSAAMAFWLMKRSAKGLMAGLLAFSIFMIIRNHSFLFAGDQEKIIVYNIPHKSAIDFVDKRNYVFVGDSALQQDGFSLHFHLKPSRTLLRLKNIPPTGFMRSGPFILFGDKHILLLNKMLEFSPVKNRPVIDLLLVSGNPKLYFERLSAALDIRQVVFDASVPSWKIRDWKNDCDSLHIHWHDVAGGGAFVMNLR